MDVSAIGVRDQVSVSKRACDGNSMPLRVCDSMARIRDPFIGKERSQTKTATSVRMDGCNIPLSLQEFVPRHFSSRCSSEEESHALEHSLVILFVKDLSKG